MLRDQLIAELKIRFADQDFRFPPQGDTVAVALAPCPELGRVEIYVAEDEVTVHFPDAAHRHFSHQDTALTREQRDRATISAVVEFLGALFADRVLVFQGGLQLLRVGESPPVHQILRRRCFWNRFLDAPKG